MKIGILLVLHVLVSYFAIIYGCGVTTHTEIAHRGAQYYEYLLDNKISIGDVKNVLILHKIILKSKISIIISI